MLIVCAFQQRHRFAQSPAVFLRRVKPPENRAGPIDRAKRPSIFQPPTSILCCASGDASLCPIPEAMARGAIPIVTDALGYGEWLTVRADGSCLQTPREFAEAIESAFATDKIRREMAAPNQ